MSEKKLRALPRNFAQDASSEVSEESPLPWPRVCVSLSRLYLDRGKEFVRCPACCVVHLCRDMQAFGPCFARRPVASDRAERARRQAPWRWGQSLSHRAGEIPCAGRGPFMVREPATGRNTFRHGVNSGKHPSLSVTPPVLRERISPCPIGSSRSECPPLLPSSAA